MSNFGIIVTNTNHRNAIWSFVDEERWNQIVDFHRSLNDKKSDWQYRSMEVVGWLTADNYGETDRPVGAPERKGKVLKTVFTQTFVVENANLDGVLLGILTFPVW